MLTVVDSPGYGQQLDFKEWRELITNELKRRMLAYRDDCREINTKFKGNDQMISRELKKIKDRRIHLALYFFDGHHPKDQDFESVKRF